MKLTATQSVLLEALDKLSPTINLDSIVDRLMALGTQDSNFFSKEEVTIAFLNWLNYHFETIDSNPEWYINREPVKFTKHLPFDRLQDEAAIEEGYDCESTYEEMSNDPDFIASMEAATRDYQLYLNSK